MLQYRSDPRVSKQKGNIGDGIGFSHLIDTSHPPSEPDYAPQDRADSGAKAPQMVGYPGAHAMGLPFKDALEAYILKLLGPDIRETPTAKSEVVKQDPTLQKPLNNYKARFGKFPFQITSACQRSAERFQKAVEIDQSSQIGCKPDHLAEDAYAAFLMARETLRQRAPEDFATFPGARAMGVSFKIAVESFLASQFGDLLQAGLLRSEITRLIPSLQVPLDAYHQRFGRSPDGVLSKRDVAAIRFSIAATHTLKALHPSERRSAKVFAKRLLSRDKAGPA